MSQQQEGVPPCIADAIENWSLFLERGFDYSSTVGSGTLERVDDNQQSQAPHVEARSVETREVGEASLWMEHVGDGGKWLPLSPWIGENVPDEHRLDEAPGDTCFLASPGTPLLDEAWSENGWYSPGTPLLDELREIGDGYVYDVLTLPETAQRETVSNEAVQLAEKYENALRCLTPRSPEPVQEETDPIEEGLLEENYEDALRCLTPRSLGLVEAENYENALRCLTPQSPEPAQEEAESAEEGLGEENYEDALQCLTPWSPEPVEAENYEDALQCLALWSPEPAPEEAEPVEAENKEDAISLRSPNGHHDAVHIAMETSTGKLLTYNLHIIYI